MTLDVRDANGKTRFRNSDGEPAPRVRNVGPGTVRFGIGCSYFNEVTEQVYMCVYGRNGATFTSVRWRFKGHIENALKTRRLEMCLKGQDCPMYEGEAAGATWRQP